MSLSSDNGIALRQDATTTSGAIPSKTYGPGDPVPTTQPGSFHRKIVLTATIGGVLVIFTTALFLAFKVNSVPFWQSPLWF